MVRATLEESQNPVMEFKRWGSVLVETQRLHLSWLIVTKDRLKTGAEDVGEAEQAEAKAEAAKNGAPAGTTEA